MDPNDLLLTAGRTTLVYFFILFVVRLLGKRDVGSISAFDFIVALMIGAAHGGIEQANGEGNESSGDNATARASVTLGDGVEQVFEVPLAREHALWKVAALDPFERLTE